MDALAEEPDARLREWTPETAAEARERAREVIELADQDLHDVARSGAASVEAAELVRDEVLSVDGWLGRRADLF